MKKHTYSKNKKANFDYEILDKNIYEAGISLKGAEIKAIQKGNVSISESYISYDGKGSLFLKQSNMTKPSNVEDDSYDETRERRLLLHKSEIKKISSMMQEDGYTCVPLEIYRMDDKPVKIQIAVAKGKTNYDKRQSLKDKTQKREIQKTLSQY